MRNANEEINKILSDWNPIEVPKEIALEEYRIYIPTILTALRKNDDVFNVLIEILTCKMELDYNPEKKEHVDDLKQVCEKLLKIEIA